VVFATGVKGGWVGWCKWGLVEVGGWEMVVVEEEVGGVKVEVGGG
jgi:hypothetical protein